jgi:PAS domain S-box-containing protein
MATLDSLARHTLDTLPLNVAVTDDEGTILLTNRAWDEFAGVGPEGDDMVGVNYLEATDTDEDDYAAEAVEGLRDVIEGDRELFTLEYPCHSPDQKRWFLMRATPLPPEAEGSIVVAHIDITARKLAELQTRRKQRELEHILGRLQGLVVDVMEAVLHATDRADIERTVCEQLAQVDDYAVAWVGRVDLRREAIVPSASAGVERVADGATIPLGGDDPVALAVERHEPEVCRDRSTVGLDDVHDAIFRDVGATAVDDENAGDANAGDANDTHGEGSAGAGEAADGAGALAVFPLVHGTTEYGVLTLYASESDAFDERELAVLQVLARVASTAINAAEGRRILATDSIVEVEVTLRSPGLFFADLSTDLDCILEYEGTLYGTGEAITMLFVASEVDPEALLASATGHAGVEDARLLSAGEDTAVLEVTVDAPPLVDELAERGAETTALRVENGQVRVTFEHPAGADTRAFVEVLEDRYGSVSLAARRERERREQTRGELVADIEAALTDRQRLALEKAHIGGFFDWPREVSGEDLAESMDISPSTYHQHLRAAERKVLDALFEGSS